MPRIRHIRHEPRLPDRKSSVEVQVRVRRVGETLTIGEVGGGGKDCPMARFELSKR
jgi:hypothetical protein